MNTVKRNETQNDIFICRQKCGFKIIRKIDSIEKIKIQVENGLSFRFSTKANAEVPKSCTLSFRQQDAPKWLQNARKTKINMPSCQFVRLGKGFSKMCLKVATGSKCVYQDLPGGWAGCGFCCTCSPIIDHLLLGPPTHPNMGSTVLVKRSRM